LKLKAAKISDNKVVIVTSSCFKLFSRK